MKSHFVKRTYEHIYGIQYLTYIVAVSKNLISEQLIFEAELDYVLDIDDTIHHNSFEVKILDRILTSDNTYTYVIEVEHINSEKSLAMKAELERQILDYREANKRVVELEEEIEMLKSKSLWKRLWGI